MGVKTIVMQWHIARRRALKQELRNLVLLYALIQIQYAVLNWQPLRDVSVNSVSSDDGIIPLN